MLGPWKIKLSTRQLYIFIKKKSHQRLSLEVEFVTEVDKNSEIARRLKHQNRRVSFKQRNEERNISKEIFIVQK